MKVRDVITKIENYPNELLSSHELVKLGFVNNHREVTCLRVRTVKTSLSYVRFGKQNIRFLKLDVIDYIKNKISHTNGLDKEYDPKELFNIVTPNKRCKVIDLVQEGYKEKGKHDYRQIEALMQTVCTVKSVLEKQLRYIEEMMDNIIHL